MIKKIDLKCLVAITLSILLIFAVTACFSPKTTLGTSNAYAVIDVETGIILDESFGDIKMPMASTTKIMTAITVLENIGDLDEKFAVPKSAVGIEGSSVYLTEGEAISVRELLYCLMLRSGNDAAVALSIITAGSIDNFVKLMNKKAIELGATNTHFTNPHGLHDDKHYTTAKDLAVISAYAMKMPIFKEIVSTKVYKGERGTYKNKNKLLFELDGANGVKTGYTKIAGRCLVSSVEREGNTVLCVVLDCPTMYETSKKLIESAFSNYSFVSVWKKNDTKTLSINGIPKLSCAVGTTKDVIIPIKKGQEGDLRINIILPQTLDFPVKKGQEVGQIDVLCQNNLIFSQKIYTIENVGKDKLIFS